MLIVLEGVNGAGKSSLATCLLEMAHSYGIEYAYQRHFGVPEAVSDESLNLGQYRSAVVDEHFRALSDVQTMHHVYGTEKSLAVFDRFHWGTYVYGRRWRPNRDFDGWGDMGEWGFLAVERAVHNLMGTTVLLDGDSHVLAERITSRGDELLHSPKMIDDEVTIATQFYRQLAAHQSTVSHDLTFRLETPADRMHACDETINLLLKRIERQRNDFMS